jgi:hypothetical protein
VLLYLVACQARSLLGSHHGTAATVGLTAAQRVAVQEQSVMYVCIEHKHTC